MAVIDKRTAQNGKTVYRVRIRIKGHRTLTGTFERLTDARDWAQKEEADIKRGLKFDDFEAKTKTLTEAITKYLDAPHDMKPQQLEQRKAQLQWWKERLGPNFLATITPKLLAEAKRELVLMPCRGVKGAPPLKPATVNQYLLSLSAVLEYARKELHWLHINPMHNVEKMEVNNGRTRFLTKKERDTLLEKCEASPSRLLYPLVMLAISTGMRKGELLNLCWKHVDFPKGMIRVLDTKNGDARAVPLTGKALEILKAMKKVQRLDTDLIFARRDGKAPMELKKHWEAAVEASELADFRFHDLRHTAATYLLESGATLVELSSILGHRNIQMVKRYAHLADAHAKTVVAKMNKRVFGG